MSYKLKYHHISEILQGALLKGLVGYVLNNRCTYQYDSMLNSFSFLYDYGGDYIVNY